MSLVAKEIKERVEKKTDVGVDVSQSSSTKIDKPPTRSNAVQYNYFLIFYGRLQSLQVRKSLPFKELRFSENWCASKLMQPRPKDGQ